MKALAILLTFVYVLFVLPKGADSCCCPTHFFSSFHCYCNFFGCNCGKCSDCPGSDDAYCYYLEKHRPYCYKTNEKACARFRSSSRVRMTEID